MTTDQDRQLRALWRRRPEPSLVVRIEAAAKGCMHPRPQMPEEQDRLVQSLATCGPDIGGADVAEFRLGVPRAKAECEAAGAKEVERGGLLGDDEWVAHREHDD